MRQKKDNKQLNQTKRNHDDHHTFSNENKSSQCKNNARSDFRCILPIKTSVVAPVTKPGRCRSKNFLGATRPKLTTTPRGAKVALTRANTCTDKTSQACRSLVRMAKTSVFVCFLCFHQNQCKKGGLTCACTRTLFRTACTTTPPSICHAYSIAPSPSNVSSRAKHLKDSLLPLSAPELLHGDKVFSSDQPLLYHCSFLRGAQLTPALFHRSRNFPTATHSRPELASPIFTFVITVWTMRHRSTTLSQTVQLQQLLTTRTQLPTPTIQFLLWFFYAKIQCLTDRVLIICDSCLPHTVLLQSGSSTDSHTTKN